MLAFFFGLEEVELKREMNALVKRIEVCSLVLGRIHWAG